MTVTTCIVCFQERIRDLLDGRKRDLEIREDKNRVPYVKVSWFQVFFLVFGSSLIIHF